MTQEQKELLLKDLCARLPYGVKVLYENKVFNVDYISGIYEEIKLDIPDNYTIDIEEVKPYLFPLESMTEEQEKEEYKICKGYLIGYESKLLDFYHKNHLDYRGLIPMGLANNATNLNIYSY
jgi:hypothetical protein